MASSNIDYPFNTWCAFAWSSLLLIWKNIVLLVLLAYFRSKSKRIKIPEDARIFRKGTQPVTVTTTAELQEEDWSTAGRITRVLANEVEYVPYFLVLALAFCVFIPDSTTRLIVYGCIFVFARYLHNISYILGNTYGRLIGFALSFLLLGAMTIDLTQYLTKAVVDRI
ncbi:unnamed protein product [Didymodactylos carnosus]|uniref:Uncharacterized protein n=1 Tax=Didymodactylos carnosus TaxID=1234261 RepID=A0A815CJ16_9BILA|nr:unnamed protein product [Didymodactylos carnosus]CAF4091137.1 unnamed protein product [Didymodactylos carnosus]